MIHTYRTVEYINPARELKESKRFYGQIWEKKKNWINKVTEEIASRCGEFPKDFHVFDLDDVPMTQNIDKSIIERIEALEEYVAKHKGGRPKKEE